MSSFKQLHTSDITVFPYTANKSWSLPYEVTPNDSIITYYLGVNTIFNIKGDKTTNNEFKSSIYSLTNQLYYQSYTSSLNTQSLFVSNYYESASSQRATSSYFDYGFKNYFPSQSGAGIGLLGISSRIYGNNILPNSFNVSSSTINIIDDGYGNLLDTLNSSTHIGNIFYSQGMCVITNETYTSSFMSTGVSQSIIFSTSSRQLAGNSLIYNSPFNYNEVYISGSFYNQDPMSEALGTIYYYPPASSPILLYQEPIKTANSSSFLLSSSFYIGGYFLFIGSGDGNDVLLDTDVYLSGSGGLVEPINISFKNNYTLYENEIRCLIKESEFNASYNPTIQTIDTGSLNISGSTFYNNSGILKDFATGSGFSPYVTSVGLYNDNDDLLAIAKFSKPLLISPNTDMTFIINYDN